MHKLLSCRYNMDTNRVEARFTDGSAVAIECIAVEDEYGNSPAQRAELDWLLYNKPLEYAQLVLGGETEHYLSLGCEHCPMFHLQKPHQAIFPDSLHSRLRVSKLSWAVPQKKHLHSL